MAEIKKRRQQPYEARAKKARPTSSENEVRRRTSRQRLSRSQSAPRHQGLISAGDREAAPEKPELSSSISKVFNSVMQKLSLKALNCSAQVATVESTGPMPLQSARSEEHVNDSLLVMTSQATYNPSTLKNSRESQTGEAQRQSDQEMRPQMEKHYFHISASHKEADVNGDRKGKAAEQMVRKRSSTPMPNTLKTRSKRQVNYSNGKPKSKSKDPKNGSGKKREKLNTAIRPTASPKHEIKTTKRVENEINTYISTTLDGSVETKLPMPKDSSSKHESMKVDKKSEKNSRKLEKKHRSKHSLTEKKTKLRKLPVIQKMPVPSTLNPQEIDPSKPGPETNGTSKCDDEMSSFITSSLQGKELDDFSIDIPLFDNQEQCIENTNADVQQKVVEQKSETLKKTAKHKSRSTSNADKNSITSKGNKRFSYAKRQYSNNPSLGSMQTQDNHYCTAENDDDAIAKTVARFPVNKSIQLYVASQIELPSIKPRRKVPHRTHDNMEASVTDQNCQNSARQCKVNNSQNDVNTPFTKFGGSLCNSLSPQGVVKMMEKEGGEVTHEVPECTIQIPPFFPKGHTMNRRILSFLKFTPKSELAVRMDVAPHLFHSVYFEVPDQPCSSTSTAFNHRVTLYLNAQGICAYFGYAKMLSFMVTVHSIGQCTIKANEPCFIAGVHDSSKFGDVEVISPACLAMRRGNGAILDEFMKQGWCIHDTLRVYYRRLFTDQDYLYDDGIDYLLEVAYNKPGHNLKSIFKTLIYGEHSNFQIRSYRLVLRDLEQNSGVKDNVSIPRRLLKHLINENSLNNCFNILSSITMFVNESFFEGSVDWNNEIQVSQERTNDLIRGLMVDDVESARTFDQDCCLALCLGILQIIRDLGPKAKNSARELLLQLTLRILAQTCWIVEFSIYHANQLTAYFNTLEEAIVIESDTITYLQQSLPELIHLHYHSLPKDVNCLKVSEGIKELCPHFNQSYCQSNVSK